jgi:hypothetical protein
VELGVARQELELVCTIAHNLHNLDGSVFIGVLPLLYL